MKNITILFALLLLTNLATAQQKGKIKGSKTVTIEKKEITDFDQIEVSDNVEIFLIKGDECGIEIEADDNLHEAFAINVHGGTLFISSEKEVSGAKKFSLRITYKDDLKMLTAHNDSNITALADIILENFTFKAYENAKIFANVKSKSFTLVADDKSKTELNLTTEQTSIELSKTAQLKALISTTEMKCDMYQKSVATIEGDAIDLKLRLDNNANFAGKSFTAKTALLTMEGYTNCSLLCNTKVVIDASGKAEIQLYGEQQIEMKNFTDSAVLSKKPIK